MLFLLLAAIPCLVDHAPAADACRDVVPAWEIEKLPAPGVTIGERGAGTASATRAPWVDSNGWRFLLKPNAKYLYDVPKGKAPLAAAEAFAFGVNAQLRIVPADAKAASDMLAFLRAIPDASALKPAANIAVIDNGSKYIPEVLNLMVRRNLLARLASAPDPTSDLNLRIGSPEFPEAEAANPVAVTDKARKLLTDRKRLLRIYGAEVVIGRLYIGGGRARLHLLNYGSGSIAGIRVRVQGSYPNVALKAPGFAGAVAEDVVVTADATEFTVPEMGPYAVVELGKN